jgi:hypothetical protein
VQQTLRRGDKTDKLQKFATFLEPQDAAKLRDLCAAREVSQAAWITDKIRRSRV